MVSLCPLLADRLSFSKGWVFHLSDKASEIPHIAAWPLFILESCKKGLSGKQLFLAAPQEVESRACIRKQTKMHLGVMGSVVMRR